MFVDTGIGSRFENIVERLAIVDRHFDDIFYSHTK